MMNKNKIKTLGTEICEDIYTVHINYVIVIFQLLDKKFRSQIQED
jgi:hypothetical protein